MAADLNQLAPAFRPLVVRLLDSCAQQGLSMRPYFTLRSPFEQARLWRQSRSSEQINVQIAKFKAQGAHFLAYCIESVGPQNGPPVTNALPGFSWHQWGEAVDCFWLVDCKAEWSVKKLCNGCNGYRVCADTAQALGLTPGGLWPKLKDWPHIQLRPDASPLKAYGLPGINAEMEKLFGNTG